MRQVLRRGDLMKILAASLVSAGGRGLDIAAPFLLLYFRSELGIDESTVLWLYALLLVGAVVGLVTGQISVRELGGPIRIGQVSGEAVRMGFGPLIGLIAALSINLAILNLLPIPVLDGGGLLLLLAEAIRRRPLSVELRTRITNVGLIVVTALMLFAISNDVFGLFRR